MFRLVSILASISYESIAEDVGSPVCFLLFEGDEDDSRWILFEEPRAPVNPLTALLPYSGVLDGIYRPLSCYEAVS